jgi:HK97 family phage major capsid protein
LNDWAINGVPLYVHHAMPADTFLIGDSRKALVWDREQVNVKMSESDATNFTTNKTTIRIEERLAVATYDTAAFISATFTDAKDSLT